jgi:uncharacterized protein (DUF433 family)
MDYQDRITIDPLIRSGKPCIKGTRIAVADVLDYLGLVRKTPIFEKAEEFA